MNVLAQGAFAFVYFVAEDIASYKYPSPNEAQMPVMLESFEVEPGRQILVRVRLRYLAITSAVVKL